MFFLGSENLIRLIYFKLSASVFPVVRVKEFKDAFIAVIILRWVLSAFKILGGSLFIVFNGRFHATILHMKLIQKGACTKDVEKILRKIRWNSFEEFIFLSVKPPKGFLRVAP